MIKDIKKMCKDNNVELLYLCKFGSHLYGTNNSESDTDYKGIFLPSKDQCYLGEQSKNITYTSGDNNSKNSKDDIDVSLWSLQYFLKLVSKGETNAIDLLYSNTFPEMIIYKDEKMKKIFHYHQKLFNIRDCNSYIGYALGQAKKYGIKGSRLGILKNINQYIHDNIKEEDKNKKLSVIIPDIISKYGDGSLCFSKIINNIESIIICGKVHMGTIYINEFCDRVNRDYDKYGERAKMAEENKGIDWKAISHAMRSLFQMDSLIEYGEIVYPLMQCDFLKEIKNGDHDFKIIEQIIVETINDIELKLSNNFLYHIVDRKLIRDLILEFYE